MSPIDDDGKLKGAMQIPSPNCDARPENTEVCLLIVHSISLPPGEYGGADVTALFTNALDPDRHPYFRGIASLKVSSHIFIRRDGGLIQFVPFMKRAWHAGISSWQGRSRCNDFSIGVELEGTDDSAFTDQQYETLNRLITVLTCRFPIRNIVGHSDVAPGRKTDPGPHFDYLRLSWCGNFTKKN